MRVSNRDKVKFWDYLEEIFEDQVRGMFRLPPGVSAQALPEFSAMIAPDKSLEMSLRQLVTIITSNPQILMKAQSLFAEREGDEKFLLGREILDRVIELCTEWGLVIPENYEKKEET